MLDEPDYLGVRVGHFLAVQLIEVELQLVFYYHGGEEANLIVGVVFEEEEGGADAVAVGSFGEGNQLLFLLFEEEVALFGEILMLHIVVDDLPELCCQCVDLHVTIINCPSPSNLSSLLILI